MLFDLSSVDNTHYPSEGKVHLHSRNGLAHITIKGVAESLPLPMLRVLQAKPFPPPLQEIHDDIIATREKEALRRFPTWQLQDCLAASISSSLLIGVPALAASPNIPLGWDELDPSKWSPAQEQIF